MEKTAIGTPQLKIATIPTERAAGIKLIQENSLPTSDIDEDKLLYVLWENGSPVGTGGIEIFDDCVLLRSISVDKDSRGKGYGKLIVSELEKYADESGLRCLYLLTTTARDFFSGLGYAEIPREKVSDAIKRSSEFTSICPSSATVMKKILC